MLLKLGGHISNCLERAANAEHRALQSTDSATRSDNELLAQSWRHLARSYQFVESLDRFLSETARENEEIVLPEMLAVIEEQPSQSESKPVLRRRRVKHEISFRDRLLKNAQDARAGGPATCRSRARAPASKGSAERNRGRYRHVGVFARIASAGQS